MQQKHLERLKSLVVNNQRRKKIFHHYYKLVWIIIVNLFFTTNFFATERINSEHSNFWTFNAVLINLEILHGKTF